ncbi:hypothetical protein [Paraburkholderia sp. DHOC27]|uniref:hypothetical protein n=1 Tax=Paraburkholderia sp. DHOC27 TaxID=2303330 RepID=UPI0015F324FA|nr:hypothetical protein [Paraburkholderia sp. DHOC27]
MKGVWFVVGAVALTIAGAVTVAPSIAQAAGLTRAQVMAEIAGHVKDVKDVKIAKAI